MIYRIQEVLTAFVLSLVTTAVGEDSFALPPSFSLGGGSSPEVTEFDLLGAVKIPFQDAKTQYIDEDGHDGFPAFGFKSGSDVKIAHRQILPDKLPAEFSILVSTKPRTRKGGFLFAVVNTYETVVSLGVRISAESAAHRVISLYYSDPAQIASQIIANFTVPKFNGKWTRFAFRLGADNVTLFFNCNETETAPARREPLELVFDSASTLYIAQAGPQIGEPYEGALDQLKIFREPNMAADQCKTDFQGFQNLNPDYENEITEDVERSDYDGTFREGSGSEEFRFIPPPPPPPDGKSCVCGGTIDNCCNYIFNDVQAGMNLKGEKGDRGPKGSPGESIRGPPGPPGPPGLPGAAAPEGACSCNLTSIISSLASSSAVSGAQDAEGKIGPPGIPGIPGLQGEKGAVGPRGEKGERGERGGPGPAGPKGDSGKDGQPGQAGAPGPPGPPGPIEFENVDPSWKPRGPFKETVFGSAMTRPGVPGPKGEPGKPGPSGPRGEKGPSGAKGSKGDAGSKGERGDRGMPGEKGNFGEKGAIGPPGLDGIPGVLGSTGKAGEKGDKGERGAEGPPGPPGISYTSDMTQVISGTPGSKGDPGLKGDKGDKGDAGESGIPGVPGMLGGPGPVGPKGDVGVDGALGPVGPPGNKGEKGERGPPGAVIMPDGNEQIITLKGEKGDMGRRGRRGKPGPPGPAGPPGKAGPVGEIGLPGWMGRPGSTGLPGIPGAKGEKGDPGNYGAATKGDKGDRGQDGVPGRDGTPGLPGAPGRAADEAVRYIPVPGPPGPPGPPGTPGLSITGPKGEPGGPSYGEPTYNLRPGRATASPPAFSTVTEHDFVAPRIVPGAVTFQDRDAMTKMSDASPVGTLAYVVEEEALLVRVNNGWQYILLGTLLPVTTPAPPTTTSPQIRPPFEASNLINHISKPADIPNWYPKMLRMAALNEAYTGDVHGVRGADYACYREARRAGLRGTFRAFLSSRVQNVDSIVRAADRKLPVSNLRGEVLFNSWAAMFKGDGGAFPHPPRIYSFSGKNVLADLSWPHKAAWHGALVSGERALDTSCDAWHSASKDKVGLAGSLRGPQLLEQTPYSCDKRLVLLCIEATTELFVQRRRRSFDDSNDKDPLLTEEEYENLLQTLH